MYRVTDSNRNINMVKVPKNMYTHSYCLHIKFLCTYFLQINLKSLTITSLGLTRSFAVSCGRSLHTCATIIFVSASDTRVELSFSYKKKEIYYVLVFNTMETKGTARFYRIRILIVIDIARCGDI